METVRRAGRCRRQPESDRSRGHDRSDRSDHQRSLRSGGHAARKGRGSKHPRPGRNGGAYAAVDMHTLWPLVSRPSPKVTGDLGRSMVSSNNCSPTARIRTRRSRGLVLGKHHDSGDASLGDGATPFMRAAKAGDVTVMRLLRDGGADPDCSGRKTTRPRCSWRRQQAERPRHIRRVRPRSRAPAPIGAIELCLEAGVDINALQRQRTDRTPCGCGPR